MDRNFNNLICVNYAANYGRGRNVSVFFAIKPGHPGLPADVQGSIENPQHWCAYITG